MSCDGQVIYMFKHVCWCGKVKKYICVMMIVVLYMVYVQPCFNFKHFERHFHGVSIQKEQNITTRLYGKPWIICKKK